METVFHTIPPVFSEHSEILILGTMPSPKSREAAFYYAHPQNRFWPALALVYGAEPPKTTGQKVALLLEHNLALWDVLKSCEITGASDASIRNPVANDISALLKQAPVRRVLCTGSTSARLYRTLVEPLTHLPCTVLPSPSAANARTSLEALVCAYKAALLG